MSPVKASFLFAGMQNGLQRNVSPGAIGMTGDRPIHRPAEPRSSAPRHRWPKAASSITYGVSERTGGMVLGC